MTITKTLRQLETIEFKAKSMNFELLKVAENLLTSNITQELFPVKRKTIEVSDTSRFWQTKDRINVGKSTLLFKVEVDIVRLLLQADRNRVSTVVES